MNRSVVRGLVVLALLVVQVLGAAMPCPAAPRDRKAVMLRGRVIDAGGWPIAGARVTARGERRVSTTTDADGQYVINLALGSPAGLARAPLAVRVRAERRGWRLALPGGEPELGIELRVVAGADGVARCEVRSNHEVVGGAIVRALLADGDAMFAANMNFIGVRGEELGAPASLDLALVERVALAGVRVPGAPSESTAATPRPTAANPDVAGPAKQAEARSKPPAAEQREAPALAREDEKRRRDVAREGERLARHDRAAEKARTRTATQSRPAADGASRPAPRTPTVGTLPDTASRPAAVAPARPPAAHDWPAVTPARPPAAPGPPAVASPEAEGRTRASVPPRPASRRDTIAAPPAASPPAAPAAKSPAAPSSRVRPKPDGQPRARSAPLVIRAPGPEPAPKDDACACRIEGTVEVDSDRPLPERLRVAISVGGRPAIADTVEMFMGSPRGFRLPPVPCGTQRLRLVNLGLQRFDVEPREATSEFRCQAGALRQFRIVLRAR